jgi:hypothetical protein
VGGLRGTPCGLQPAARWGGAAARARRTACITLTPHGDHSAQAGNSSNSSGRRARARLHAHTRVAVTRAVAVQSGCAQVRVRCGVVAGCRRCARAQGQALGAARAHTGAACMRLWPWLRCAALVGPPARGWLCKTHPCELAAQGSSHTPRCRCLLPRVHAGGGGGMAAGAGGGGQVGARVCVPRTALRSCSRSAAVLPGSHS